MSASTPSDRPWLKVSTGRSRGYPRLTLTIHRTSCPLLIPRQNGPRPSGRLPGTRGCCASRPSRSTRAGGPGLLGGERLDRQGGRRRPCRRRVLRPRPDPRGHRVGFRLRERTGASRRTRRAGPHPPGPQNNGAERQKEDERLEGAAGRLPGVLVLITSARPAATLQEEVGGEGIVAVPPPGTVPVPSRLASRASYHS